MDTSYLSYEFLNEVMAMSKDVRDKYSKALTLITNNGTKPEKAFQETGFEEAYQKEKEVRP
jgi:hypothetical protein